MSKCGSIYLSGANCSKELVEQIAEQLATRAVRDTEFADASELSGEEYIAIVQDGVNKKIPVQLLLDALKIPVVTHDRDGLMSKEDKIRFDEMDDMIALTNSEIDNLLD